MERVMSVKKVIVQWPRFGPYHFTRFLASKDYFQEKGITLKGLEIASTDLTYLWNEDTLSNRDSVTTLITDCPYENIPKKRLSESLLKYLDAENPDVLVICGYINIDAKMCLDWCTRNGKAAVLMSETTKLDKKRYYIKEKVKSFLISKFQSAICGGYLHRSYLHELGMPSDCIFEKYDVVDNEYFDERSKKIRATKLVPQGLLGLENEQPFILASNRFIPRKNIKRLLEAYSFFKTKYPHGWPLVLLGDGPQSDELKALVNNNKIPDVTFAGFRQIEELPEYYARASLFIHPAESEPWGLVVNEAMASGLPILASNRLGCSPNLVREGINGFKFDPFDSAQIFNCLCRAYENKDKLGEMGQNSRTIVDQYSPAEFASSLYAGCLKADERNMTSLCSSKTSLVNPMFTLRSLVYYFLRKIKF